ncbi:MAG: DUF2812 domain-containing protein [Bacillota bacterium]|nr:DUF2812 domain-containing protein [Bacillota bacterium]
MRITKHKLFFAWEYEKEELWLNEMSAQGLQLVGVGFCKYIFEEGTPSEYSYRIELLNQYPTHPESVSYIHFLEGSGIEHVGSYMRWVYLRKKSDGAFDLFSDIDSKISHCKRILTLFLCLLPLEISALTTNAATAAMGSVLNMFCAILLSILLIFLAAGTFRLWLKIKNLKKERIMHE